jgi:hypothetical protein
MSATLLLMKVLSRAPEALIFCELSGERLVVVASSAGAPTAVPATTAMTMKDRARLSFTSPYDELRQCY